VAASQPVSDALRAEAARLARVLQLRRTPEVRLSDHVLAPQVIGLRRPRVLLPSALIDTLSLDEQRMTLCHELMHVRRRDLALGWIPAIAERLFFFHPLARLAGSEYRLAREAACDAAVLATLHVETQAYARLLLRLGLAGSTPGLSVAGASPSSSSLKRRLVMLHRAELGNGPAEAGPYITGPAQGGPYITGRRFLWGLTAVVFALALVPIDLTARQDDPLPVEQLKATAAGAPERDAAVSSVTVKIAESRAEVREPRPIAGARFGAKPAQSADQATSPTTVTPAAPSPEAEQSTERILTELRALLARQREREADDPQAIAEREALMRRLERLVTGRVLRQEIAAQEATPSAAPVSPQVAAALEAQEAARRELSRDMLRMSEYVREIERAHAQLQSQRSLAEITQGLDAIALQMQERAGETRSMQRLLAELSANHPDRVALERQIQAILQQRQSLAVAQERLARQRQLFEEAQRQLAEAEEALRDAENAVKAAVPPRK
jgi:Zn-dependent protease with chaperone function